MWIMRNDEYIEYSGSIEDFNISSLPNKGWIIQNPPIYQPSQEQIKQQLINDVQLFMDEKAKSKGYDNIFTAVTYENDLNTTFAAEGAAFKKWRSDIWTYCYQVLSDVENNVRPIPTSAELISELPIINI